MAMFVSSLLLLVHVPLISTRYPVSIGMLLPCRLMVGVILLDAAGGDDGFGVVEEPDPGDVELGLVGVGEGVGAVAASTYILIIKFVCVSSIDTQWSPPYVCCGIEIVMSNDP